MAVLSLGKGDCLYLDLLSNSLFMGSDEDGLKMPTLSANQTADSTFQEAWYFHQCRR